MIRILAALALCLGGAAAQTPNELASSELGNVLHCLDKKLGPDYAPPRFESESYRVRYVLGVVSKGDSKNELQLAVYGKGEKRGKLYQVYLEHEGRRPSIYIGAMGTLKQEKGVMEPDEIWGGQATYYAEKRLLRVLSAKPAVTILASEAIAGPRVCIYEQ